MSAAQFLLIDVGNSRVKWATADVRGPIQVEGEAATDEVTATWTRSLARKFPRHHTVLASVVPKLSPAFARAFAGRLHPVAGNSPALGLRFRYPNPAEIGADRLAGAVAVLSDGTWPAIVVNSGTATAFTVLDAKGHVCGGAIAPGLHTQLAALIGATAQLPATDLRPMRRYLARSTGDAIRAGVMLSFQGGVKEILERLGESLPGKPLVVVTGGNAGHLTETLQGKAVFRPLLVFEGLRMIGLRAFIEVL